MVQQHGTQSDYRDLLSFRVLVTAGPTREPIDPVRYLSNRSSGKMGYAIAEGAEKRGALVTLISGPVAIEPPANVQVVPVETAAEMYAEVLDRAFFSDVLIMSAAVADYRVAEPAERKMKRSAHTLKLELVPNPDILAAVGRERRERGCSSPLIVGFALETDELMKNAQKKLERKGCDLLVANLAKESIGLDASIAHILDATGVIDSPGRLGKKALADRILDCISRRLTTS